MIGMEVVMGDLGSEYAYEPPEVDAEYEGVICHHHVCPYCGAGWDCSDLDCSYGPNSQLECDACVNDPERSDDFSEAR
jgi:hypothetical protein